MCRIAAYLGPPLPLHRFLLDPPHSLYAQSWRAREQVEATINADGFGLGWHAGGRPLLYRQPVPVWADANLPALARSLHSPLWLGNVRSATEGLGIHALNTQPFADSRWLFTHNGRLGNFARELRPRIRRALSADIEADIHGNTDSEYLFALLRQLQTEGHGDGLEALRRCLSLVEGWLAEAQTDALLSLLLSDGHELFACRHAVRADCPSLYYCDHHPELPQAVLVASEPFDDVGDWRELPPHHCIALQPGRPARPQAL